MNSSKGWRTAVCILGMTAMRAHAANDAATTVFNLGASYDEESAYSLSAGVDHPFTSATRGQLDVALVRSPESFEDVTTQRAHVGIDHSFDPVGITLGYEYWGDRDTMITHTLSGSLYWQGERVRTALTVEQREIELELISGSALPRVLGTLLDEYRKLSSTGVGLSLSYRGKRWSPYLHGTSYSYEEDLGRLESGLNPANLPPQLATLTRERLVRVLDAISLANASSLTLANGLLKYAVGAGLDCEVGASTLNLSVSRDRAETFDTDITTFSTGWLTPLGKASDVEFRLGVSDSDQLGAIVFGAVTFLFYR